MYVGKAAYLRELLRDYKNQCFLSRPRWFGTSEEAMARIGEKGGADRFASNPRRVFSVDCVFD